MSVSSSTRRYQLRVEALEERAVPSTAQYVTAVYTDLLHRQPSAAETASWVSAFNAGTTPAQMIQIVSTSPELRQDIIISDYSNFLHRTPSAAEVALWQNAFQGGMSEDAVAAAFLASPEYVASHGNTPMTWLNSVYEDVLGRPADPFGLVAWLNKTDQPMQQRYGEIALGVLASPEAHAHEVTQAYQALLNRNPDPSGLAAWEAALAQNPNPQRVLANIAASPEFISLVTAGTNLG